MSSSCVGEVDQVGVGGRRAARTGYGAIDCRVPADAVRRRPATTAAASALGAEARAGAAGAAVSPCAAHRRHGRRHAATGTAGRDPRRSPMRAPPPAGARRPAGRPGGPSTGQRSSTTRHSCRTIHVTAAGIRSRIDAAAGSDSPSLCCGAYQITRGCAPARFMASAALPCFSRPALVMKSALPTTVTVRPVVGVAHHRALVAPGHGHVARRLDRCRSTPNCTSPARVASRRSQSGAAADAARPRRGGPPARARPGSRDTGSTSSRSPGRSASRRSTSSSTRWNVCTVTTRASGRAARSTSSMSSATTTSTPWSRSRVTRA